MKSVRDFAAYHAHRPNLHNLAHLHVLVCRFQVERDVALECGVELPGVQQLERLEESERGGYGGWGGSGGCGGWNMTQAGRDQHPSHSDLQPSLWLDHDVSLRRNRRLQPLEELHGFRVIGGIAELVVPLLQSVPVRPDALRQDLVDQRQQRAVRTAQGAEVLHLIDQPPQLLRVGVLRRPAPGERAYGREKLVGRG